MRSYKIEIIKFLWLGKHRAIFLDWNWLNFSRVQVTQINDKIISLNQKEILVIYVVMNHPMFTDFFETFKHHLNSSSSISVFSLFLGQKPDALLLFLWPPSDSRS